METASWDRSSRREKGEGTERQAEKQGWGTDRQRKREGWEVGRVPLKGNIVSVHRWCS